ncbi:MAG: LytR family transcriptional regulator [Ruminococcaceae bacterium]|nr:LytR family transcriptional regulator [Oscillospiraceae bacterium]
MPENNNRGRGLENDFDIEAYLDLLDSESGNKRRVSRDFSNLNETLSHEKASPAKFIDIEEEETIRRPAARRPYGESSSQQQINVNSQRQVTSQRQPQKTPDRKPAPPRYKQNGEFVNMEEKKKQSKSPVLRWFYNLPKKRQTLVKVLSVFLVITIVLGSALGIYINSKFNMMGDVEDYTDEIYAEEEFSDIDGDINASNFKDALKKWATTGNDEKMSSKNVVNVLLIGADSRQGTNTGNTDVMMLVSLNKKTKQIKLVSFMRDSYLYIEGKNNSYCSKLNAAFSMGGPETLMNTIENNYKIEIDDFVMVNFESFKSIIEAMDGITVDVQKYEANYANNRYKLSMPYGDGVTLNGEEALAFCRIRGCDADGDVSRTRRQRQVINAMIDRVRNASISDLNRYLNALLPYIYTGFSKSEILSLGMKAITNGWATYERSELQIPTPETRTSGSMGSWIWVVDYQLAAQTLQYELYGDSNITLEDGRTTLIDIYNGTSGSGSSSGGGSSTPVEDDDIEDDNSNNETTVPVSTTEPETEEFTEDDFEEDMGSPDIEIETDAPTEPETDFIEIPDETEEITTDNTQVTIGDDQ